MTAVVSTPLKSAHPPSTMQCQYLFHPIGDSHLLPELEGDHDTRSVPQPLTYDELGVICDDGDAVEIATGYFWARVIGRVAWLFAAALAGDFG